MGSPLEFVAGPKCEPRPCRRCFCLRIAIAASLTSVLRHSGVFVGRQYATFAGITHGQKVHDFVRRVLARPYARPMTPGANGRTRVFHVHYKPLHRAIDETDNRHRRPPTIEQALERLLVLDGVLTDRPLTWLGTER